MTGISAAWIIAAALALDLLMGDPSRLPHPVRLMGAAAARLEKPFRAFLPNQFTAGLAFAAVLVSGTYVITLAGVLLARLAHPAAGTVLEILLVYTCICPRCLYDEAGKVHQAIAAGRLDQARVLIAMLVSRDTANMDESAISRAAIETVAENFVDGVLSPLFFAAILGAPGAMAFKMISTLDSMVGYRTEKYEQFGKVAARLDDAANWIPARLCVPIISLAAALVCKTGRRAFKTSVSEGGNHKSPNAGRPEAAFAGALGVRLIGPGIYHGRLVEKPWIGADFSLPGPGHILPACRLMIAATLIAAALMMVFPMIIG
ncbi:MAG: adenosylcobinamide-phosphate synthase CbiB [Desulfosalsimonas sp.]|uniref:adenosylcobinamide-phosphate synthase CbiB n=1 Tax=Desulfosalsimonas sp. TaxID=3073848 RepID=UPI003970F527